MIVFAKKTAKRFVEKYTSTGFIAGVGNLRREWRIFRRHRSGLKKVGACLDRPDKKLNLGCGPNPKPGWINVDLFDSHADIELDLREKWPFADNSISYIYSEHVFEHFDIHTEVGHFLLEARRVLQPGGIFDLGVPDSEWPLHAYGNPSDPYWPFAKTVHPESCETQLDHVNFHFRQGTEHKYAWDYETLAIALKKFGFNNIVRREFDPSLDAESRRTGSLYLRATNP